MEQEESEDYGMDEEEDLDDAEMDEDELEGMESDDDINDQGMPMFRELHPHRGGRRPRRTRAPQAAQATEKIACYSKNVARYTRNHHE